jgi:uridine kinase
MLHGRHVTMCTATWCISCYFVQVDPADVVIVEGILVLHEP